MTSWHPYCSGVHAVTGVSDVTGILAMGVLPAFTGFPTLQATLLLLAP